YSLLRLSLRLFADFLRADDQRQSPLWLFPYTTLFQSLPALRSFQQLTAPFDGIITARAVDRGALITAGSGSASAPLFRIARAERLRIYVSVPQTWVRALTPGGQARGLVPEFPERTFLGQVVSTAGALDQMSRTVLTEV